MVKELICEKERNAEPDDPYATTRIPLTNLAIYTKLIKALPSIEEYFFRKILTKEERKETIHSFTQSSSMNYLSPPLNDSASAVVKKADTTLHRIQVSLDHATCSIGYYTNLIIQESPKVNEIDPHILFNSNMRVLMSDIASTVTQGRLENLHKGMELPAPSNYARDQRSDQGFANSFAGAAAPHKAPLLVIASRYSVQKDGTNGKGFYVGFTTKTLHIPQLTRPPPLISNHGVTRRRWKPHLMLF
ncbi:hypothetical protein AYI70_g1851 [Smittium culicis]|uniref:Uncharacterized protein n=1 Tax=Smittium culicis TaxID=133412 RepID=A0A1R1YAV2_9FUNG|nr:hypothetical protein AYI70_g1851 [Smittium culicis]